MRLLSALTQLSYHKKGKGWAFSFSFNSCSAPKASWTWEPKLCFGNYHFLMKMRLFRKLLPSTPGIWTGPGSTKGQACPSKKTSPSTREESSAFRALLPEPATLTQHSPMPFHHKTICTLLKCCPLGWGQLCIHTLQQGQVDVLWIILMHFSAEKAAFIEVWEGLSSKSLSDMTLNSCEGRERAEKPRKGWLNELSCKKSLAHVHEVKGQNICNVYVSPVFLNTCGKL